MGQEKDFLRSGRGRNLSVGLPGGEPADAKPPPEGNEPTYVVMDIHPAVELLEQIHGTCGGQEWLTAQLDAGTECR